MARAKVVPNSRFPKAPPRGNGRPSPKPKPAKGSRKSGLGSQVGNKRPVRPGL